MPYPLFYYIRLDSSSKTQYIYNDTKHDAYQFEFGINQFCNHDDQIHHECCEELYDKYIISPVFGTLLDRFIKKEHPDTTWDNLDLEGPVVQYFWNYKLENSSFPMPTSSPTLPPTQPSIFCEYTSNYLSIICELQPSYTFIDSDYDILSIHGKFILYISNQFDINSCNDL